MKLTYRDIANFSFRFKAPTASLGFINQCFINRSSRNKITNYNFECGRVLPNFINKRDVRHIEMKCLPVPARSKNGQRCFKQPTSYFTHPSYINIYLYHFAKTNTAYVSSLKL